MYREVYIPTHTNMGCYLGGIILGAIYYSQRKNHAVGNRAWVRFLPLIVVTEFHTTSFISVPPTTLVRRRSRWLSHHDEQCNLLPEQL